jgi:hypothetical protein
MAGHDDEKAPVVVTEFYRTLVASVPAMTMTESECG